VHSGDAALGEMGAHTGDWEHVTLKVGNTSSALEAVYMSQHDGGQWFPNPSSLERHGEQIVVYASKNGHASYPSAGVNYSQHRKVTEVGTGLEFFLRNDTATGGDTLDCSTNYQLVSAPTIGDAAWLAYPYRWGPKDLSMVTNTVLKNCLRSAFGFLSSEIFGSLIDDLAGPVVMALSAMLENGPSPPSSHAYWSDPGSEK
jgi:hypothetical protein